MYQEYEKVRHSDMTKDLPEKVMAKNVEGIMVGFSGNAADLVAGSEDYVVLIGGEEVVFMKKDFERIYALSTSN